MDKMTKESYTRKQQKNRLDQLKIKRFICFIIASIMSFVNCGCTKTKVIPEIVAGPGDGSKINVTITENSVVHYKFTKTWSAGSLSKEQAFKMDILGSKLMLDNDLKNVAVVLSTFPAPGEDRSEMMITISFKKPQIVVSGTEAKLLESAASLMDLLRYMGNNNITKQFNSDERIVVENEFRVDESLIPVGGTEDSWDGKKEGAIHTIKGDVTIFDHKFVSNPNDSLRFMMSKEGYKYISGKGSVKNRKTGKLYNYK